MITVQKTMSMSEYEVTIEYKEQCIIEFNLCHKMVSGNMS